MGAAADSRRPGNRTVLDPQAAAVVTEPDLAISLPNLRQIILTDPWRAVAYLHRLTDPTGGRTLGPAHRVDAVILTAEAHLRLGNPTAAASAAQDGYRSARRLKPADPRRRTIAVGVLADIAVRVGAPDAVAACINYVTAVSDSPPDNFDPHDHRLMLASGLFTVATYHHDCREGRDLLTTVLQLHHLRNQPGTGAAMMDAALRTMNLTCSGNRDHRADSHRPPPLPGGLLHQNLGDPPPDYLTDRIDAKPARHTCPAHSAPATPSQR